MMLSLESTKDLPEIELLDSQVKFVSKPERIREGLKQTNCTGYNIVRNGRIVGFFLLRNYAENEYFLWDMMIDKKYQGKGVGKTALNELMRILHTRGATILTTTYVYGNDISRHLFESVGFREHSVVDEKDIHEVNMIFQFDPRPLL